jgi:hypothetical protein
MVGGIDLPVFAAEVEVRVVEGHAHPMGEIDRFAAGAIDEEPRAERFVPDAGSLLGPPT